MLEDKRLEELARVLVNYSCEVQAGENVAIEASATDYQFVNCIVREVYKAGGRPFVTLSDPRVKRYWYMGLDAALAKTNAELELHRMKRMQCYIGVRGGENCYELADVPNERLSVHAKYFSPVQEYRVNKTKWVVLRYPTQGMAELSAMSTEAFEDLYFKVCTLDYRKMDRAMDGLVALMDRTDRVRLVAQDTDLSFSIKDIPAVKCSGARNIPDGEVYTAPVKNSVNGVIHYNVPSVNNGIRFEDVRFVFKAGRIVEATANRTVELNRLLDIDAGARYVGEFALGVNPHITRPMGDILFDEKISGSLHFTPGRCYEDASNGNKSSEHWDLVLLETPEYGGGEVWFDDRLIRKDGRFVAPELEALNPENLI